MNTKRKRRTRQQIAWDAIYHYKIGLVDRIIILRRLERELEKHHGYHRYLLMIMQQEELYGVDKEPCAEPRKMVGLLEQIGLNDSQDKSEKQKEKDMLAEIEEDMRGAIENHPLLFKKFSLLLKKEHKRLDNINK
jgi:hypothetical protein